MQRGPCTALPPLPQKRSPFTGPRCPDGAPPERDGALPEGGARRSWRTPLDALPEGKREEVTWGWLASAGMFATWEVQRPAGTSQLGSERSRSCRPASWGQPCVVSTLSRDVTRPARPLFICTGAAHRSTAPVTCVVRACLLLPGSRSLESGLQGCLAGPGAHPPAPARAAFPHPLGVAPVCALSLAREQPISQALSVH